MPRPIFLHTLLADLDFCIHEWCDLSGGELCLMEIALPLKSGNPGTHQGGEASWHRVLCHSLPPNWSQGLGCTCSGGMRGTVFFVCQTQKTQGEEIATVLRSKIHLLHCFETMLLRQGQHKCVWPAMVMVAAAKQIDEPSCAMQIQIVLKYTQRNLSLPEL